VKPADFDDGGYLLPFGRHKGYALGVLVSLLGGLTGTFDVERGTVEGKFIQVIDVAAFTPLDAFCRGVRATLDEIKRVPPAPGTEEVLVPGEPEHRARAQRLADGIEVPEMISKQIRERARRLGVSLDHGDITDEDLAPYRS
jgi:LDH2 family malate/lactate/ureidoglycolate dehydrogenase